MLQDERADGALAHQAAITRVLLNGDLRLVRLLGAENMFCPGLVQLCHLRVEAETCLLLGLQLTAVRVVAILNCHLLGEVLATDGPVVQANYFFEVQFSWSWSRRLLESATPGPAGADIEVDFEDRVLSPVGAFDLAVRFSLIFVAILLLCVSQQSRLDIILTTLLRWRSLTRGAVYLNLRRRQATHRNWLLLAAIILCF